jgi:hypothetical protein
MFQRSILDLQRKRLKDAFSFQMSLQATEHCVGAMFCPQATGWVVLHHTTLRLGKKGKDIETEVSNNVETSKNSHFAIYHFTRAFQVSVTHIYNIMF